MIYLTGLATGTPPRVFEQRDLFRMAGYESFPEDERRKLKALFRAAGVDRRAMWLETGEEAGAYAPSNDPDDFHSRYVSGLRALAPRVARAALENAGLSADEIDFVVFCSCTGYTCPSFSVELAHAVGVGDDKPTASLLGMGCSAFIPSLQRGWDFVSARPGTRALVVAAEICSATYWIDRDPETAVGNALFADGAAAAVISSAAGDLSRSRRRPARIDSFRTLRDPRHLGDMGFNQREGRLRVRLAREIPERILPLVSAVLDRLELPPGSRLAVHPGGRKILDLLATAKPALVEQIAWSRSVLRERGNMSSPTVAFVLERSLEVSPARDGEVGALLSMGPGLSVEAMRIGY